MWGFCARLEKGLAVAQQTAIIDARETKVAYSDSPVPTIYFHSTITGEIKMEPLEVPLAARSTCFSCTYIHQSIWQLYADGNITV